MKWLKKLGGKLGHAALAAAGAAVAISQTNPDLIHSAIPPKYAATVALGLQVLSQLVPPPEKEKKDGE